MVKIIGSEGQPVSGSGFIIRSDGYIITCHHVIYFLDSLKKKEKEKQHFIPVYPKFVRFNYSPIVTTVKRYGHLLE